MLMGQTLDRSPESAARARRTYAQNAKVRERLQILGLPEVAVTLVLDCGEVCDGDPWTWRDVAKDPLEVGLPVAMEQERTLSGSVADA
jgi:hypothetical protein